MSTKKSVNAIEHLQPDDSDFWYVELFAPEHNKWVQPLGWRWPKAYAKGFFAGLRVNPPPGGMDMRLMKPTGIVEFVAAQGDDDE